MSNPADAELQVRLRRAAFNRALAEGDLAAIAPLLSPVVVLITGSDSAVISGRKAQLAAWKRDFAQAPRAVYVRSTDSVIASAVEPIAMEHGRWSATVQESGEVTAAGTYAAKWRKIGNGWVLVAEIFLTLG